MKRDTPQWSRVIVGAVIMGYNISDTKPGIEPSKVILSLIKNRTISVSLVYFIGTYIHFIQLYKTVWRFFLYFFFFFVWSAWEGSFKFKLNLFCLKHVSIPTSSQWHLVMSTPDDGYLEHLQLQCILRTALLKNKLMQYFTILLLVISWNCSGSSSSFYFQHG